MIQFKDNTSASKDIIMNELYGILKKLAKDNHYENFTKGLNSAHTTEATQATLRQITSKEENGISHCSQLVIHKGICYSIFLHNYGEQTDDAFSKSIVLEFAEFSLERALSENFDYRKDTNVICFDKDESITGHISATSAFKCNSLCLVGDDIYITLGAQVDGKYSTMFMTKYDTVTKTMEKSWPIMISYKDKLYELTEKTVSDIYIDNGLTHSVSGNVETTAKWSEYKGEYYTTACLDCDDNPGLIIKTRDFKTLETVSVVKDNVGACEVGSIIYEDRMYLACRQAWTKSYMTITRYDLETGEWLEPYKIEDGTSRPWFFIWNSELYLYNTITESRRRWSNISKVRTSRAIFHDKNAPLDTIATIFDCGHYCSFFVYEGRVFFTGTIRGVIHFGELKLKQYDAVKVNHRLIELFGDLCSD